jgi:GntR family transcriptional regulator/MocR family aminotransferase
MKLSFPFDALSLDKTLDLSLHLQLYRGLRSMLDDQTLRSGDSIPSSRSLALQLGVARNTVVNVYDQLTTEGYLSARKRARPVVIAAPSARSRPVRAVVARRMSSRGETMFGQPHHAGSPGLLTFHPGMPDSESFPFNTWSRLLAHRAKVSRYDLFGSYSITGYPELQEAIARYVQVARGVRCRPEQIVITTGAQAALDLLARLLLDPGDVAWVEEPGYYGAQAAFVGAGAELAPLFVNEQGWVLEPRPGRRPRLIYVTPACQHPLGRTMQMEQRLRLLDIADELDAFVIEDDFDGEYRFVGRPIPAIQGDDRYERVIYVGTFAKLLFPALRLGFMVLPEAMLSWVAGPLLATGQYAPLLLQAALADFINQGHMSKHLKRMRSIYSDRRRVFQQLAEDHLGSWLSLLPTDAGIQFVGEFKAEADDRAVAAAAKRRGMSVSPLSIQYRHGAARAGLVMGYAATNEAAMPSGFKQLAEALREILGA